VIEEVTIDVGIDKKIVLISDMHLGVYKDWVYLQKVVNTINTLEDIDMVLIAGDFTNQPTPQQSLGELFQPLGDLQVSVYAVLGNHDVQKPGPDLRHELVQALEAQGVVLLHNDTIKFDDFFLVGLGPSMSNEDKVSILDNFHVVNNVLVLAHNPDTTLMYRNYNADLTLVGHTHCGQIKLPWIHNRLRPYIYPVEGDWDC
jgi:predicted MPP superfamily phosphohydrolase